MMLPPQDRLLALRECVVHFAPYGFRPTWHHLLVNARIPRRLEDDSASLVRAVAELDEARHLWMECSNAYAARRRQKRKVGGSTPPLTAYHASVDVTPWHRQGGQVAR
ncbi:hypothetical protein GCM10022226_77040 [Sphaerisporangium flaviroseum]|uniref:DUF2742 domain-containing protein n=1 Tax=Sphaerisporangium flaviroseum TaxID=509199 RepID=A0ABP7JE41_9ACTN